MSTRPGWYPDPSGRYPKRWYDGEDWTASVIDHSGQQSYDQLPPAGAPPVTSLPPARSPWAPEAASQPSQPSPPSPPPPGTPSPPPPVANGSWQPGQPWAPSPSPAQPFTSSPPAGVWSQQPVTTASLGLTPPRDASTERTTVNPLVYVLVVLGVAGLALAMFVLDWYSEGGQSIGFRDFSDVTVPDSAPFLDQLASWHFEWLGVVVAGVALLSVILFVVARVGAHRVGHVIAAVVAMIGVLLSTFAIVRVFRADGFDPDIWAWVLPAGYLVLLVAVVVSARSEPD